ncbi:hypothetical protein K469DRAFT_685808 [Zopfia rhizophila CBS 207.26]|uniref:Mediator of RNA polymerase II transcription subunit 20 n=1 Tax=Zopfia rhizophila CBS 207.26 TaxID=1314779 RepID=A0A6A6E9R2_9PEZI|nr:hypothetical protein K469DRAFT_685808 [Zopfia rhizophila CBS 207.26]
MKFSGLYYIPTHASPSDASTTLLSSLISNIESRYENYTRQPNWTLSHRLLRSVPPPQASAPPNQLAPLSYQHVLHLSYLSASKTYCYIQPSVPPQTPRIKSEPGSQSQSQSLTVKVQPSPAGALIAIPSSQTESHLSLLINQFSPLWAYRQTLSIPNGIAYSIGEFTIFLGDLRLSRSGTASSSNTTSPGTVVCISTSVADGEEEMNEDSASVVADPDDLAQEVDQTAKTVRDFWDSIKKGIEFGKVEMKEVMMDKLAFKDEGEGIVRMWCEVLRLRG